MTENPFSPPVVEATSRASIGRRIKSVFRHVAWYVGAYFLGIIASIALTPVEMNMGGYAPLWFIYPILAPIGYFLFYFYLEGAYLPFGGTGISYWTYVAIGLAPFAMEPLAYFAGSRRLRWWRPVWIGFPIGFVGALGVYYTAAASV